VCFFGFQIQSVVGCVSKITALNLCCIGVSSIKTAFKRFKCVSCT
jgi:hypothetical protein